VVIVVPFFTFKIAVNLVGAKFVILFAAVVLAHFH
jgi:hypothetical protein